MTTFKDNKGRLWNISVDAEAIARIKAGVGIDLADVNSAKRRRKLFALLAADPVKLVAVIYHACDPQIRQADVTPEDFGRALASEAIDRAITAILLELVNIIEDKEARARARGFLIKKGLTNG